MDLFYPDGNFCKSFSLLDSLEGVRPSMAVDSAKDAVQELLQLLTTIKNNSNEAQVECCMKELADNLHNEIEVDTEFLEAEEAQTTIVSAMQGNFRNRQIQQHGCYVLSRLVELSPKVKSNLRSEQQAFIFKVMKTFKDDVCTQAVSCKIIAALCNSAEIRKEALSGKAVHIVLSAVSRFGDEEECYLPAFEALTQLLTDEPLAQEEFMDSKNSKKNYRLVVEVMEKQMHSAEIQDQAVQLMCVLASSNTNCKTLVAGRTFIVALEAMKKHPNCSGLQASGCHLLKLLAMFESHRDILVEQNVVNIILRALRQFPDNVDVQKYGMAALGYLTEALEQKVGDEIQNFSWTEQVFTAMTTHCDKPEVLKAACHALHELIDFCPTVLTEVGDEPNCVLPLHRCAMAALMLHMEDAELCQSICRVLASIVSHASHLRESLISKGVYLHIIAAMQQHSKEPGVQQWGCRALRTLSFTDVDYKMLLVKSGVLELVFNCTLNFPDDYGVQEEAIALIACLATDVELVWHQSAIEGFHSMILKAMRIPDQVSLTEISLEALGALAAAEEIPALLVSKYVGDDCIGTILNAMKEHDEEPAIQQKALILIQVLAPLLSTNDCQLATSAVIHAMCQFPEDRGIIAEACVAMSVIAQMDTRKSEMLVNNCAHERLFFVLENFPDDQELVFLASECILFLGWKRNLKTSMLLSACAGGLLNAAVCLIKKGADVNMGDGSNTPLCCACKNGKEQMVQYLLTQGITDVHSALRLSLEMGHNNIVGLLLQHLGHDKEAGIIALKGLNLGDLRPEWLSPSLSGTKYSPSTIAFGPSWAEHIEDADRTMRRRAKLSRSLTTSDMESVLLNDSMNGGSITDQSDTLDSSFKAGSFDSLNNSDNDSISVSSSVDIDVNMDEVELSEESPLRARSVSGASLPYSSFDPRIVSPPSTNHVILPMIARSSSCVNGNGKRPGLRRRAISDVVAPSLANLDLTNLTNSSFNSSLPHSECEEAEDGNLSQTSPRAGIFKMPNRSYMYSYEFKQSFREGRPRARSAGSYTEDGDGALAAEARRNREADSDFASIRRRRQSVRVISANASVRLIDASCNNMSSLQLIASASDRLRAHLAKVEKLDLSHNQLSTFPSVLCDAMPLLEYVNLSHNEFASFPFILIHDSSVKVLNLSHNKIKMKSFPPKKVSKAVMLESLNLSHNTEGCFPEWLGDFFPFLTNLYVVGNNIKKLPNGPLKLQKLKTLDLSNNKLKEIPDEFLSDCISLEILVVSNNCLATLPESVAQSLTNLKTVRLNKNDLGGKSPKKQGTFPRFFLKLPNLKVVDLSSNNLEDIPPPISWTTQQLKELILADNKIRKLSLEGVEKWAHLERLALGDNCLKQLPAGIGELSSLTSLDLSRNSGITHLPDEMGELSNLWDLQHAGLKLDLDSAVLESKTQELIGFLHCRLKNSVPYYRMKLVVVGQSGRGKTTLLNQIVNNKVSSTNDVMVRDWLVKDAKAHCKVCQRKSVNYVISSWDFKGRDDLYSAFQCLLSSRTLYLVVYDVSKGIHEIDTLKPWLLNIHACAPEASVMIVGTHLDKVPKDNVGRLLDAIKERALSMCAGPGFPLVKSHVVLDSTGETSGVKALRNRILELITRCKCKGHSLIGPRVPQNFVRLQDLIMHQAQTRDQELPILELAKVRKLIQDKEILMDEAEVQQAIKFMHEAGVLIYLDNPSCHLNHWLFVDPKWLFRVIVCVVEKKEATSGIVGRVEVEDLLRSDSRLTNLPSDLMVPLLRLLEHYCVVLPLKGDTYLLPSHLSCKAPVIRMPNAGPGSLTDRVYRMPYVPLTFWPRLITRVQTFVVNMYSEPGHRLKATAQQEPLEVLQWTEGVYVYWSEQAFFLISQGPTMNLKNLNADAIVITTPNTKHGCQILAHVVDQLDTLLEEWFPDMCELDPQEGLPLVHKEAQCPICQGDQSHAFTLQECTAQANIEDWITCPNTSRLVSLRQIAPDVLMCDLEEQYRIQESKLILAVTRQNLLGDGSYGAVYRAKYDGKAVAAKVFHTESDCSPHRLLRQEVMFLCRLRHPSIISMVGACVNPWSLMMELAPLGSLSTLLNSGQALSRGIQHRIALQVAEGLAFLHRHMIVYRDLKPHNILIFSLSLGNLINAKISDYGIARYATRCGLTATEGTPGYRAPEVARGDIGYNTQIDMYSFGMFLYELVTGGTKPFEDLRFRCELDAAVMKGRALDPITLSGTPPWPDMADLIEHVLEPRQDKRATAEQAYGRLCCPEVICLKRDIPVSKGQTVECMTVRHFTVGGGDEPEKSKLEVWVGSGVSDDQCGQVTIIDLSDTRVEGCTGKLVSGKRVTSIVAVDSDTVLVGTQSGTLWAFDAQNHECKFALSVLPAPILCLRHYKDTQSGVDVVVAGLLNGQLAVYDTERVNTENTPPCRLVDLCKSRTTEETTCDNCDVHPVACTAVGRKRLLCGLGSEIVVLKVQEKVEMEIERRWRMEEREKGTVKNIAMGASSVWSSTKGSPVIDCWDFTKATLRGSVDCLRILRESGFGESLHEERVVSLLLQHKTLWVGMSTGHVILLDPVSRQPLQLIHRHVSAVRCLVETRGLVLNKPTSLVLTGGMGFIERPGCKWKKPETEFGYALVWEADFWEQAKHLSGHTRKRQELTNSLVEQNM